MKEMTQPWGQGDGAANTQLSKNWCAINSIQFGTDQVPSLCHILEMGRRRGVMGRGQACPQGTGIRGMNPTREETEGSGGGSDFTGARRRRQKEEGVSPFPQSGEEAESACPRGLLSSQPSFCHLSGPHTCPSSPVLAQVLTSGLGLGSALSIPRPRPTTAGSSAQALLENLLREERQQMRL